MLISDRLIITLADISRGISIEIKCWETKPGEEREGTTPALISSHLSDLNAT